MRNHKNHVATAASPVEAKACPELVEGAKPSAQPEKLFASG